MMSMATPAFSTLPFLPVWHFPHHVFSRPMDMHAQASPVSRYAEYVLCTYLSVGLWAFGVAAPTWLIFTRRFLPITTISLHNAQLAVI